MEMPELTEDILEGGSNSEILNPPEDSENFDESVLQNENETSNAEEESTGEIKNCNVIN